MLKKIKELWIKFICIAFDIHTYNKPYKYKVIGYTPRILNGTNKEKYIIHGYRICNVCYTENIKIIKYKTNVRLFNDDTVISEYLSKNRS
jgi:hypothetical protein